MNVQLLLLLALAGPFCAFTHASPTEIPTEYDSDDQLPITTEAPADSNDEHGVSSQDVIHFTTEAPYEDLNVITGPPATDPPSAPEEVATVIEEVPPEDTTEAITEAPAPAVTVVTDVTEEPDDKTDAPAPTGAAPEPLVTDAAEETPAEETAAPTTLAEVEVQPQVTGAAQETNEEVVVEDGSEEGLSSGQIVGIVLGALLAVIIVIAVVIAAVRRMGKYSPAKTKKPAKKDSIMVSPLRKKSAKQPVRAKFWKF